MASACGFHGGDPRTLERTVATTAAHGVAIGAHPGFLDLVGFGRRPVRAKPDEARTDTLYQLGALDAFCRVAGVRMRHVKPRGALTNLAMRGEALAGAITTTIRAYDPTLLLFAMPGSALLAAGKRAEVLAAREAFADRAYNADGSLVSRRLPGALITGPEAAAARMLRLVTEGRLAAIDGQDIVLQADTICTHSDTPGAVHIVRAVRRRLEAAGVVIRSPRGS